MPEPAKRLSPKQQGHLYVHEVQTFVDEPNRVRIHAIMIHNQVFHHDRLGAIQTSFTTLDIYKPKLRRAALMIREAIPRFTMVEASVVVKNLALKHTDIDCGIPHTIGELADIELAVMKCRA